MSLGKKIKIKFFVIGLLVFNLLLIISLIAHLMIATTILPNAFYFLAIPSDILSSNIILLVGILLFEGVTVFLFWKKKNKSVNNSSRNDSSEEIAYEELFSIPGESQISNADEDYSRAETASNIVEKYQSHIGQSLFSQITAIESTSHQNNHGALEEGEYEFSPEFLDSDFETIETSIDDSIGKQTNKLASKNNLNKNPLAVTDRQYSFYQAVVNENWLYALQNDRRRIGFEKKSLAEANISLSDISVLIQAGLVYKRKISHPTGSFFVYCSSKDIEKDIINESIRRFCRKHRFPMVKRKMLFSNWKEFGLAQETWEFDFELTVPPVIGAIWCDKQFIQLDDKKKKIITEKSRNKLKALIATAELKLKDVGTAIIVTNSNTHKEEIEKIIQNSEWGEAKVLSFSNKQFFNDLLEIITNKS